VKSRGVDKEFSKVLPRANERIITHRRVLILSRSRGSLADASRVISDTNGNVNIRMHNY